MREIKFKVWSEKEKKMMITKNVFDLYFYSEKYFEDTHIMQYTGLKDKNGKEIYEGDILDYGANIKFKVVFNKSSFKLQRLDFLNGNLHLLECCYLDELEVVGNIYENKDLLEK